MINLEVEKIKSIILKALVGQWHVNYGHRLQVKQILLALDEAGYKIVPKDDKEKNEKGEAK